MNNINYYKIFGLVVKSEINLHKALILDSHSKSYDVEIKYGSINDFDCTSYHKFRNFKVSSNHSFFDVKNIAKYEISNGNLIKIQPVGSCNHLDLIKYIFGSCFGILLQQRGILAIHGGALVINNNGIVICGASGAGKTTAISKLINKGYTLLSDDVSSITKNSNTYNVNNCIPHQKLSKNDLHNMNIDITSLHEVDPIKNKYFSPEIKNFSLNPQSFNYLFYLVESDNDEVTYEQILGIKKLNIITSNIYRKEIMPSSIFHKDYIKNCLNICNKISVYKINRPKNVNITNEITNVIELLIKGDDYYVNTKQN